MKIEILSPTIFTNGIFSLRQLFNSRTREAAFTIGNSKIGSNIKTLLRYCKIPVFILALLLTEGLNLNAQVTAATGASAIAADNFATTTYTSLTGPVYTEGASGAVGTGTIILSAPAGFNFNTGSTAPTVLITRVTGFGSNSRNINSVASGTSVAITSRTSTTITFTVTNASNNGVTCSLTWQNVQVIPTAGTPLASGNITKSASSTSTMTGVTNGTTNFGTLTEVAGALNKLVLSQTITTQTAGTAFNMGSITAEDQFGNILNTTNGNDFTGTVTLSTNAAYGSVTPTTSGSFTNGVLASQNITVTQASSQAITAASGSVTGTTNTFSVNAGAVTKLQILLPGQTAAPGSVSGYTGSPSAQTAGTAFNVTVNAVDANWNVVGTATNSVTLTASNGNTMPGAAPLVSGTKTFSVTLTTAGSATITAAATGLTSDVSAAVSVNPAGLSKFVVTNTSGGSIATQTAGTAFNIEIIAEDAYGNTVTSFTSTVALTTSAATGSISPATSSAFVNGVLASQSVTVTQATSQAITATNISTGTSNSFSVNAGALNKLQILLPGETAAPGSTTGKTGTPTAQTAGTAFNAIVNGVDANWNVVTTATNSVTLTASNGNAMPGASALVSGTKTFSVTLTTAGSATITAAATGLTSDVSAAVTVNPAGLSKFAVTNTTGGSIATQTAGTAFNIKITAEDAYGNTVTSFTSTVALTTSASGGSISPTTSSAFVNGVLASQSVTVTEAIAQTITATNGSTGTSNSFNVNAGALNKFVVTNTSGGSIATQTAGTAFNIEIIAEDAYGNTVTNFNSTVALTENQPTGTISPTTSSSFVNGELSSQSVTLTQAYDGSTITATSGSTGTSNSFDVVANSFVKLQILVPGETAAPGSSTGYTGSPSSENAGTLFNATVNAVDANWNIVSSAPADEIHLTSSDGAATMPANENLSSGTYTFSVSLYTAGSKTITASDATNGSITSITTPAITVNAYTFSSGGYFRSNLSSGNWTTASTWQSSDDNIDWYTATSAPTSSATSILIQSGETVYATATPSSNNLTVNGTYEHEMNGGTVPTATWGSSSTLLITGASGSSLPGGLDQSFNNVTWDWTTQSGNINLGSTNLLNIGGDFTIESTNNSSIYYNSSSSLTINIGGDLDISGGIFGLTNTNSGAVAKTLNVGSNVDLTGGTFNVDIGSSTAAHIINVTGDWTLNSGATFDADISTVYFNGGSAQSITGMVTTTFANLNMDNAAGVTLDNNEAVSGTLTFTNGIISTGANTLTLGVAGTAGTVAGSPGSTSYVYGNLQRYINNASTQSVTFNIGDASNYAPVTLAFAGTTSGSGSVTISTTPGNDPNENTPVTNSSGINQTEKVNRYWTMSSSGLSFTSTYSGTFSFATGDILNSANPLTFVLRKYNAGWAAVTTGTLTATSSQATGMTTFGDIEIGEEGTVTVATNPANSTICAGSNTTFTSSSASSPAPTVKWQRSSNGGSSYTDITANLDAGTTYSGFTTGTLTLTGSTTALSGYLYRAVFTNINASATSTAATFTVNPVPGDNAGSNVSICNGGSTVLGATSTSGHTYLWSPTTALSSSTVSNPTANPSSTTTYSLQETITATGCSVSNSVTVTVDPIPAVTNAATATTCSGTSPDITLTASVASSFSWTIGTITGSITGASNGSGGTINQTLTNPSNTTAGTVQYIVTPTSTTGSCTGSPYTITVTVNPAPAVTNVTTASICSVTSPDITLTSSIASSFTWTIGTITGSITGASNGSGGTINQTLTNPSDATAGTVPYIVTPTATTGSCAGSPITITVTVNPKPAVTNAATASTCSGTGPNITLTASAASNFSWTIGTITGGITGAGNSSGGTINQTLNDPSDATSGTVQYLVTPTSTTGSCTGSASTITVTVNPTPAVTNAATATTCSGTSPDITLTASVASSFSWTIGTITGGITGASNGSGGTINQTLTNHSNTTAGTVQYIVTPTSTTGSCAGSPYTITITVNPAPAVTNTTSASVCSAASLDITLTSSIASSFTWTIGTITGSITGASAGSGGTINQTLTNPSNSSAGTVQYLVTPTSTTGTCTGSASAITVTVNPLPTISATSATICSGNSASLTASCNSNCGSSMTYTWSPNTNLSDTTGATVIANPTVTTTYTITGVNSNGCVATSPAVNTGTTNNNVYSNTVLNNYIVADQYTTSVPLTATQILTYGTGGGSAQIAIYSDASGVPGTELTATAGGTVAANGWTTFNIASTYLAPGTYWIVFDLDSVLGIALSTSTGTRVFQPYAYGSLPSTAPSSGWTDGAGHVDITYFVGIPNTTSTVTVNPTPAVTNAATASTCSRTSPDITLTASVASSFSWTIGTITGSITGASNGSGGTINQTLTNPSNTTAGTVQYIVTPTSTTGSCTGSPYTITVTVNPAPAVTNVTTASICSVTSPDITLTSSIASSFTWTIGTITGSITGASNSSGGTINQTLTNPSDATAGTVPYIVTPTATTGSCAGSPITITVTVNPKPAVTNAATASTCSGSGPNITLTASAASNFSWTIGTITGGITGAGNSSGGTINQTLNDPSDATSGTVQYLVTPASTTGSCTGSASTITVTVYPTPAVTNAATATTCSGTSPDITLTASVASSFSWTIGTITGGITGASNGSGGTINQTLTNPGNTTAGTVQYIVTPTSTTGSCVGSPYTITVTVNPKPALTNGATASTCSGTGPAITLTSSAASSFAWTIGTITGSITGASAGSGGTINQTLTNPSNSSAGTVQYLVTPTSTTGSCTGSASAITVTVNPTPAVTNAATANTCNGTGPNITLTSSAASSFAWTIGTITGSITGANAGSGGTINQTLNDPSDATSGTVQYLVTPTSTAGSCTGSASTITVTVYPTPAVTNAATATICSGTGPDITLTASAASSFAWTIGTITGTITGASAGSGGTINQTLTNPSNSTVGTVQYLVTPKSTTGSCPGSASTITVTVNPKPAITNGMTASTCSETSPDITLTSSAASNFAWTIGTITGGITGASAGSGGTINQTLTNPSNSSAGTVQYLVTPTSTTGSCAGSASPITVTVNPIPAVTNAATASTCSGTGPDITLTSSAASNFAWTIGTITGSITGASAGSGGTINQTLTNPNNSTMGTVQYLVTPTSTAGSCPGSASAITVTVNPAPALTNATTASVCSGAGPDIALTASISSSYTWTIGAITGSITGESAGSGSTINQTLTNPSNTMAGTVQYLATPTSTTGSCSGSAYTITVSVNPAPAVTNAATASICSGTDPNIALTASIPSSFTWTIGTITGGITGASNGSGSTINQTLTNPGNSAAGTVQYLVTLTSTSGSCPGSVQTITITVNPFLTVNANVTSNYHGSELSCSTSTNGQITVTASGGVPPFQYKLDSGAYQSSNVFNNVGAGSYVVTMEDAHGCTQTTNVAVTAPPAVTAIATSTSAYVFGETIQLVSSASFGGTGTLSYSWSGPDAFTSNIDDPTRIDGIAAYAGTYTVTITDQNGCSATANTAIAFGSNPVYTWTGATSTAWTLSGNWNPAAPVGGPNSCGVDVVIPAVTNQPVISSPITVGNISMNTNAQLTLNAYLNVCINWTGGSTGNAIVTGASLLKFNGFEAQTISGNTQFNEVLLDNDLGVSMTTGASASINTALDLQSGTFDASLGTLTFVSTSVDQVAIIDNFSAGYSGTVTGNIIAQRYYGVPVQNSYYQHFLGSPVSNPSFSQFGASGTSGFVTALPDCDETQLALTSVYGTLFSYHESNGATCGEEQWYVETTGNAVNGQGYSMLKDGGGYGVLSLTGPANLDTSYTLTGLTNSNWSNTSLQGRHVSSGWQLLANPYLASMQLTTVNAGFDNQVQVWHSGGPMGGSYQSEMLSTGADTIAPFQAFMVHMSNPGSGGSYTINASERVRTPYAYYIQNDNELDIMVQNIVTGLIDNTMVAFNSNASDGFDPQFDADKFGGALNRHTLYTMLADGRWMSRNVLNSINTTGTVPMGFEPGATGSYAMVFNNLSTFDPTTYVYLEDKQMNTIHNVRNGDYMFSSDSSDKMERFVLHFTPPLAIQTVNAGCIHPGIITLTQPGTANWNYTLTDVNNNTIGSGVLNQSNPVTITVAAGVYTLTLVDINNYTVTKTIQVAGAMDVNAGFAMPGTAQVQNTVNFYNTSQNGVNFTWNFGDGTIITGVDNPTYAYSEPGVYTVTLTATNAAGCFSSATQTIVITGAAGLNQLIANNGISMWSFDNRVYVDFTEVEKVNAVIKIYNVLGQILSDEKYALNGLYQKQLNNIDAAYIIITVNNDDKITTKKLFINNVK